MGSTAAPGSGARVRHLRQRGWPGESVPWPAGSQGGAPRSKHCAPQRKDTAHRALSHQNQEVGDSLLSAYSTDSSALRALRRQGVHLNVSLVHPEVRVGRAFVHHYDPARADGRPASVSGLAVHHEGSPSRSDALPCTSKDDASRSGRRAPRRKLGRTLREDRRTGREAYAHSQVRSSALRRKQLIRNAQNNIDLCRAGARLTRSDGIR
jgi:hypothetical protein